MRSAKIYDLESELNDTAILMDQNIYEDLKKNLNGSVPDDGYVYIKTSSLNKSREIAFALKYGDWCYTKAYGDPTYEKKKINECNVPFDYLIQEKVIDINVQEKELFLWREGIGDETKAIRREQIEKIEIKPSNKVSENAIYSWDVSQDKTGKVMAWYEDVDNNGYYEAYIGQNGGVKASSGKLLFAYLPNVKSINVKYLDTSQVKDMYYMFTGCSSLTQLDLSNFDTSKVGTDLNNSGSMNSMFSGCSSLTELDLSNFDTSNVASMSYMFGGCSKLTNLDLSNFDTSNVNSMSSMFNQASGLIKLDISSFNTSKVKNMNWMFYGCNKLTNLDLSNFNTEEVTNMGYMFAGCNALSSLNLSSFNTESVTNMNSMFSNIGSIEVIIGNNWTVKNATTTNMFYLSSITNQEELLSK